MARSDFTATDRADMVRRFRLGESGAKLAAEYGVHPFYPALVARYGRAGRCPYPGLRQVMRDPHIGFLRKGRTDA